MRDQADRGFVENKGQWPSDVEFMGRSNGLDAWITRDGLRLDAYEHSDSMLKGHVIGIRFVGAKGLSAKGYDETSLRTDFLQGSHGVRGARSFATVQSKDLYPGIALKNYFDGARPRYDLLVSPQGNPSRIRMEYRATDGVQVAKDKLAIKLSIGTLVENKLFAYQMIDGKRKPVKVAFRSVGKNVVAFTVGRYDKNKPLIIDPVIYGTYYGGDSGWDEVHAVVSDQLGGVYMTGLTRAPDFPAIFGPYSFLLNGSQDAFVSKLEGDVYRHDYAAFVGGSNKDVGEYLQLDQFGDLWVSGYTASSDFPGQHNDNIQTLFLDPYASQGGKGNLNPFGKPNGAGNFKLYLPQTGQSTVAIPWNADPATVQAAIQPILPAGATVAVSSIDGGNITAGSGYKIDMSPNVKGELLVDNSKLGTNYLVNREALNGRAQVISAIQNQQPTAGDFVIQASYTRGGSTFTGTTLPMPFNVTANILQSRLAAMVPSGSDPNQSPVNLGAQVKPATQAYTGVLPTTPYILLFGNAEPTVTIVPTAADEVQSVDVSANTSGTFTLSTQGGTTGLINYNASAATVQAALSAVLGAGNVVVVSPKAQVYLVEFTGTKGNQNIPQLGGNFTNLSNQTGIITTLIDGGPAMNNPYNVVPTGVDDVFWDTTTSAPVGPDPVLGTTAPPIPNPDGGAFNISVANVWELVAYNANATLLHDAIAKTPTQANIVVIPNDPAKPTLPSGTMAVVYIAKYLGGFGGLPVVQSGPVYVNSILSQLPLNQIAPGRLNPKPVYSIESQMKCFVMRFKQDASTVLNPLPTKSFTFGGDMAPDLVGFKIFPHNNPVPGEPVRFIWAGSIYDPGQLVPEIPVSPRGNSASAGCGFTFRVNYTESGGFSVQPAASQYVDAYDSDSDTSLQVYVGGIDIDRNGNIYLGGTIFGKFGDTTDTSIPASDHTYLFQTTTVDSTGTLRDGRLLRYWDGFVRKYTINGDLTYSVLVGGDGADEGYGVAVDQAGDAYLAGRSRSFNYPRTRGVYGETFTSDVVATIAKLNPSASDLVYCTHLRTANNVTPLGISVDSRGVAYATFDVSRRTNIALWTVTNDPNLVDTIDLIGTVPTLGTDTPILKGAFSEVTGNKDYGGVDGALLVMNPSGTALLYGTYLGGTMDDGLYAPYVDAGGDCWICGWTDTFRAYYRNAIYKSGGVLFKTRSTLPSNMITSLAFRPAPDPNPGWGGGGSQYAGFQLYNTRGDNYPIYWNSWRDRDGYIDRLRIGLTSVSSVTFSPTSTIPGGLGESAQVVVQLSRPAPTGGAVITMSIPPNEPGSFDPSGSVTSTSVTIAAGASTGAATIYSEPVSDNAFVDVTASYQGNFKVGRLVVTPWLQSFSATPSDVVGGNQISGLIQLAAAAPAGGITLTMTSDTASVVRVTSVNVPAGQSSFAFKINTAGVDSDTTVTVNAALLGVGKATQLVVHPAQLKAITFDPNPVTSGSSSTGTVVLNGKAGTSGFKVNLSVEGAPPGYVFNPSQLVFSAGAASKTFTIQTPYEAASSSRIIDATMLPATGYTPNTVHGTLTVEADPLQTFTITPNPINGGATATGQVTIATPALKGGATVDLSVSPDDGVLSIPQKVTLAQGATTASFTITSTTLLNDTVYTLTASRGSSTQQAQLTVKGLTFTVSVPAQIAAGGSATGTVTLSGPAPSSGLAVKLVSSNPSVLPVPDTLTIAPGAKSVTFPLSAALISTDTNVTITATIGGKSAQAPAVTTVHASRLVGMTITPSYVQNLYTARCTLTLDGPAPTGGLTIVLSSTNAMIASVPSTVTIPAGTTSLTFSIPTHRVTRTLMTIITADSPNGGEASATLTVHT